MGSFWVPWVVVVLLLGAAEQLARAANLQAHSTCQVERIPQTLGRSTHYPALTG